MEKKSSDKEFGYKFLRGLLIGLYNIIYHPKRVNVDKIPKEGPCVIICNHTSKIDPCSIATSTNRMINFLAKSELFAGWYGGFFRAAGCISVNCDGNSHSATTKAIEYLKEGRAIGLYPEGEVNRTKDKILLPLKNGCIKMAKEAKCVIVPACLVGKYRPFINDLKLVFGDPIDVTEMSYEDANKLLYDTMYKMLVDNGKKIKE